MRRRQFTALLPLSLAGCVASEPGSGGDPTEETASPTETRAPATSDDRTDSKTSESTETASPPGKSRFAGEDCPPVLDACYHEATAKSKAYVRPSKERATRGETVEFTLVNRSDAEYFIGPYHWRIWREAGGSWTDLSPEAKLDLGAILQSGATYSWTAEIDADGGEVWPDDRNSEGATIAFTPGRYCFGIDVDAETENESLGTVGCLFEVTKK